MQLGARSVAPAPAEELAGTLRSAAEALGHRPAVTVLRPDRREEQGFASLAQWASKTAHWLEIEHLAGPGDVVSIVGPPGWLPVAVCLGAWWAGVTVRIGAGPAAVAVVHEAGVGPDDTEVVSYGDAVDGSPIGADDHEPFAMAVQAFPDQPPAPRAEPDTIALRIGDRSWTHAQLLAAAGDLDPTGTLGIASTDVAAELWVPALAVRPLLTGSPTVLLAGVERDTADGERVHSWLSSTPS